MDKQVEQACADLDKIFEVFDGVPNSAVVLSTSQGWTYPGLSPSHVAWLAKGIADALRKVDPKIDKDDDSDSTFSIFVDVTKTLKQIVADVLPNVSGSLPNAVQVAATSLTFLSAELGPVLGWDSTDKSRLPSPLIRRISQLQREIDGLIPDKDHLAGQIRLITEATEAAEALPTTLQELKSTQAEVRQASNTSSELIGKIQQLHTDAADHTEQMRRLSEEGEELIKKASEAYRITTTIGLAAAFDERAKKLNQSVYVWVGGLAISLITLLVIGYIRLEDMRETFAAGVFDGAKVWTQVALSVLSVGAPIWFAWLSTKQIGQRFRLAEDYAFKASVSKAYEGYRREARDLSPEFAQSLFGSALKRLDEAPLRLLEMTTHGSPIHEALHSRVIARFLDHGSGSKRQKSEVDAGGSD
ncbi:hypothetical protein AB9F45_26105 [Rhizobium leguminosarum]|uniref:hypothetical protein n=1 Tax=Rhizobium leguminosarum TaxID=384 RepID=UPI003F9DDBEA